MRGWRRADRWREGGWVWGVGVGAEGAGRFCGGSKKKKKKKKLDSYVSRARRFTRTHTSSKITCDSVSAEIKQHLKN